MKVTVGLLFLVVTQSTRWVGQAFETPVEVNVRCKGIDFKKLSVKAASFSAMALQDTYNTIHKETDGGDSALSGIHFDHPLRAVQDDMLHGQNNVVDSEEDVGTHYTRRWGLFWNGVYHGDFSCRFCPNDDFMLLGGSGEALRAWEALFTRMIMESPHQEFIKVKTCKITMKPLSDSELTSEDAEDPNDAEATVASSALDAGAVTDGVKMGVEVDARCKGINFAKLSVKAASFSAMALQDSYNQVHEETDGGDSALSGIHFDHPLRVQDDMLRGQDNVVDSEEDVGTHYTRRWGLFWNGVYHGDFSCRFCPNDDFMLLGGSGEALRAWEALFTRMIMESPHQEFIKVKTCKITMKPLSDSELTSEDAEDPNDAEATVAFSALDAGAVTDGVKMGVEVDARCKGINFAKLSVKAASFSAMALQDTYNTIHKETDGGDSALSGIHFDHPLRVQDDMLRGQDNVVDSEEDVGTHYTRRWGLFWNGVYHGDFSCRFCPNDDFMLLGGSGEALRAWEALFTRMIMESPHKELNKVKTCKITMKPLSEDKVSVGVGNFDSRDAISSEA